MSLANKHPKGLYLLSFLEMWERFSYYGMLSMLFLYMEKSLGFSTPVAGALFGTYTGWVYLTPLIGGHIADRFIGPRKAVILGAAIMAVGHFLMAVNTALSFYAALILIVAGTGFFKPNISAMVGSLYSDDASRSAGFNFFYMAINAGAFVAPLVCGYLGSMYGWHYGFSAAGVGLTIGLVVFAILGGRMLGGNKGSDRRRHEQAGTQDAADKSGAWRGLFFLFPMSVLFFAAYSQAGSSLMLFVDRSVDRSVLGFSVPAMFFQSLNPAMVVLLAPLVTWFWGRTVRSIDGAATATKFAVGFCFSSFEFTVLAVVAGLFGESVGMAWLLPVFAMQALGEMCVAPVGLAAVTKMAPRGRVSLALAVWFLSMFVANFTGGLYAGLYDRIGPLFFFIVPAVLMGLIGVTVLLFGLWMRRKTGCLREVPC